MFKIDKLKNGLKILTEPMGHMESISIGVWLRAGSRYEDTKNNGISHLLEHLLFKGTERRDAKSIKEEIEGRGGSFNGFTTEEFTCYLVKLLSKDAEIGVDILSDMVFNPRLDEEEMKKEKDVIIEEINMYKDIPSHHVHEILTEMMWPGHELGMPLAGTVESIKSIDKKALISYKETFYNPKNMLLVGVGRLNEGAIVNLAEKHLSKPPGKDIPGFNKVKLVRPNERVRVNFKETEQTHIAIGLHTLDRFHPDRYVLSILNIILGANMSSRLFHIVRDELALCYEISSSVRLYEDAGALLISAGVDDKKLIKALEVVLKELHRIRSEMVPAEELNRAKEYYRGQLLFALEDTMSRMLWLGEKVAAGEKEFDVGRILERIEKVSPEDLLRVSNEIFKNENLNLAIIGPVKEEDILKDTFHL